MDIINYYPYECGQVVDIVAELPASQGMAKWHAELACAAGVTVDNKQTFEIADEYDRILSVQFWDFAVYIAKKSKPRPGARYFQLDDNGSLVKQRG